MNTGNMMEQPSQENKLQYFKNTLMAINAPKTSSLLKDNLHYNQSETVFSTIHELQIDERWFDDLNEAA